MRFAILASAALAITGGLPGSSSAQWGCCLPVPCVTYETRVVTCYRAVWVDEKVECVVPKLTWDEEVVKVKHLELVPRWEKEKRSYVHYTPVWREEDREVVRCVPVPVCVVDPCTGCVYTSCRLSYVTDKVRVRVCDYQAEKRDVDVTVCHYSTEERVVEHRCMRPRVTYEKVDSVRRVCRYEPYETTVCVPVYGVMCR